MAGRLVEDARPVLDAVAAFTIVGKTAPRRDAIDKVRGKAKYAGDIIPANALHARIVRPPAHGMTAQNIDTAAAEKMIT